MISLTVVILFAGCDDTKTEAKIEGILTKVTPIREDNNRQYVWLEFQDGTTIRLRTFYFTKVQFKLGQKNVITYNGRNDEIGEIKIVEK